MVRKTSTPPHLPSLDSASNGRHPSPSPRSAPLRGAHHSKVKSEINDIWGFQIKMNKYRNFPRGFLTFLV